MQCNTSQVSYQDRVKELLRCAGFRQNSRSWYDYSRAKQFVGSVTWIDNYDETIQAICDYLGV